MANSEVHVKAVAADGTVQADETFRTMANGFFELWLPRNQNYQLSIQGAGRTATGMVGTFPNSKTCITTFHLQ